jgi:hypothetical protein
MKNTYIKSISTLLIFVLTTTFAGAQIDFGAYYTKVTGISAGANLGKYADIIVVVGPGKQLEFTRATAYMPVWRTPSGTYNISSIIKRESDPDFLYTYVRLLQNDPEKIVIQMRYYESVSTLAKAVDNDDPLNVYGITGIVLETFTINRDNTVTRTIKRATGSRYEDWINPAFATTQTITLQDNGISEGTVRWGTSAPILPRVAVSGSGVKNPRGLPRPVKRWTFDEGLTAHNDEVKESINGTACPIDGLMTEYFPGVSGTALALDGYYSGVRLPAAVRPSLTNAMTVEAWVSIDNYPWGDAPIMHNSTGIDGKVLGQNGWYLGVDVTRKPFFRINGVDAKSPDSLTVNRWTHIVGTYDGSNIRLYVDAVQKATAAQTGNINATNTDLVIGRNTEKSAGNNAANSRNLPLIYGIEGLIDQVCIYNTNLNNTQIAGLHNGFIPANRTSPINSGVLPGDTATGSKFGASFIKLQWQALWDKMWRDDNPDISIKFDGNPTRVIFWRGTNYSPNLVTENNIWYNDQSCELGLAHGYAEHMSDKQQRECVARIIENTAARIVVHWHYACVDIAYDRAPLVDEYYTIYPDGTMVRNVSNPSASFQDTQLLITPGQNIQDIVNLQANTMMNLSGNTLALTWTGQRDMPKNTLTDAMVELINTKSTYKPYLVFTGGYINTWGDGIPFSYKGWDHYPVSLLPSQGKGARDNTRLRHCAGFGANDFTPSQVLYGLTTSPISGLLDLAKMFNTPPKVSMERGAISSGFTTNDKSYGFTANASTISFTVNASVDSPLLNPCFVIRNWGAGDKAGLKINGVVQNEGPNFRQGKIIDTDGTYTMIIWVGGISSTSSQKFVITKN